MLIKMLDNPTKIDNSGVTINIGNNPIFNKSIIKNMAKEDFRKYSVDEIYQVLLVSYNTVFEDLAKNIKSVFVGSFKNVKFLEAMRMIFVTPSIGESIPEGNRIACNRLISDIIFNPSNYNADLATAAEEFAYAVNKKIIDKIVSTLGETIKNATLIVVTRYYCNNERDNIHFLNWFLINTLKDNVPKKYIVYLYGILFDNIGLLFTDIMCSQITKDNPDIRYIKAYNLIADAIFDILDTQPLHVINAVLVQYNSDVKFLLGGDISKTRFPLYTIEKRYPRVGYVYNYLKNTRMVDVI